jgi:hypothetical protein
MTALIAKVVHWPHVNAAAAFRGSAFVIPMLSGIALYASTYAQLKKTIFDVARKIDVENSALLARSAQGPDFDLIVAGRPETGPETFGVFNHRLHGVEPWSIVDLGDFAALPGGRGIIQEVAAVPTERLPKRRYRRSTFRDASDGHPAAETRFRLHRRFCSVDDGDG